MEAIKRRLYIYTVAAVLGAAATVPFFFNVIESGQRDRILLIIIIAAALMAAGLSIREYRRFKAARLIIENKILHIQPAVIDAGNPDKGGRNLPGGSIEVYISCFGILLDSRIIKFNRDGIRLIAVELEEDYISLTYGTDKRTENIRLLRAAADSGEIKEIAEKFRYETGVVSTHYDKRES